MLSYWEQKHFISYDYIIVGAGIVGLSTAACILEKKSKAKVLILERGLIPAGASTKNAGFACFGEISELVNDIKKIGEDKTLSLVEARWKGLKKLRKRVGDKNLEFKNFGGYEVFKENQLSYLEEQDSINKLLKPIFKKKVYVNADLEIKKFKLNSNIVKSLIRNEFGAQLDSGLMIKNLVKYVQEKGATVLTGALVNSIDKKKGGVYVKSNILNNDLYFNAKKIAVCTNGFAKKLIPSLKVKPARGQVIVTKPIKNLKFKGYLHFNEGYDYLRNIDNRILFGGGRNLDYKGASTSSLGANKKILKYLESTLKSLFTNGDDFIVDSSWSGIMGFSNTKEPIVKSYSNNIHIGVALGGMGVALGSNIAENLSKKMI